MWSDNFSLLQTRATEYLDSILACDPLTCTPEDLPYVTLDDVPVSTHMFRAPCLGSPCILETSINLLPPTVISSTTSASQMLAIEKRNVKLLGEARKSHYLHFPLSHAVDGRPDTVFYSVESMSAPRETQLVLKHLS